MSKAYRKAKKDLKRIQKEKEKRYKQAEQQGYRIACGGILTQAEADALFRLTQAEYRMKKGKKNA